MHNKKNILRVLLVVCMGSFWGCAGTPITMLLYMASDRQSQPYIDFSIKQLEREGIPEDLTVVAFVCSYNGHQGYKAKKIRIRGHTSSLVESISRNGVAEKDMLLEALTWAAGVGNGQKLGLIIRSHYPSHSQALVGICLDEKGKRFLSDKDLRAVLEVFSQGRNSSEKPLAFVGFDGCRTATVEMASALAAYCEYMIGSGHYAPVRGWPYDWALKAFKEGTDEPKALARAFVRSCQDYYSLLLENYCVVLFDLNKFDRLMSNLDTIGLYAQELITKKTSGMTRRAIAKSVARIARSKGGAYIDLVDWYNRLLKVQGITQPVKNYVIEGLTLIKQCVIETACATSLARMRGLLIYLPNTAQKKGTPAYAKSYWAEKSKWNHVINL